MGPSNPTPNRRRFLQTAAAGAAWLASPGAPVTRMAAQSPESRVDILLNEPVGTIAPEIYRLWGWAMHHYAWNASGGRTLAGLTLDTFNRHADKVAMAAVAQLVNCLQSLFLAHEDKFCLTPTYHVFDLYAAHQGARSVRTLVASPATTYNRNGTPTTMRGLNGSASVNGSQLTLTVTNPSMDQAREAEILIHGGTPRAVAGVALAAGDPHAHNGFDDPRAVEPKTAAVTLRGAAVVHQFPPASVTKLTFTL